MLQKAFEGFKEVPEVTMLVIRSGEHVVIVFDPNKSRRGWTFLSTKVRPEEDPVEAIRRAALEKLDLDLRGKPIRFVKKKEKKGTPFSSFTLELAPEDIRPMLGQGPRGHTVRAIPIGELAKYLDRGRYDMGASNVTGIPTL